MNVNYFKTLWRNTLVMLLFCFGLTSWGQTEIIAFNGAETSGTTLTTSSNELTASNTNSGTPNNDRIKSGSRSFQQQSTGTKTLITNGVSLSEHTSNFVEIWNAMVSTSTGNGIDGTVDKLEIYVSETSTFGSTPDVTVNSSSNNIRWGMSGTGVITTTAGTPVTHTYSHTNSNGTTKTGGDAYSKVIINIPDTWENVFIKIVSVNDSANEVWCIDDIAVKGIPDPSCTTPTYSFESGTVNKIVIDEPFINEFISDNTSAFVWSSTDTGVATVDANGEVTIVGAGTTEIRVNQEADDTYCAVVNAGYTLNVAAVTYAITATSNNETFGTVSLAGNIITATPAAGYTYATPAYTVTEGSATVDQNGNEFTVTPDSECTVQINFEAKPSYTLSLITDGSAYTEGDFPYVTYEGDSIELPTLADCGTFTFVGWDTNSSTTSAPTYTGGATYMTTGENVILYAVYSQSVEGSGTTTSTFGFEDGETGWTSTATISTTNPKSGIYSGFINVNHTYTTFNSIVASPISITFSLRRTSNNENNNVQVQTSTDNLTWTTIATYQMTDFANGSYTEKTTDLNSYSNVFVRVYVNNTTATRYIDDFSITYAGGTTTVYTTTPGCDAAQLIVSTSSISNLVYAIGNGPSTSQAFELSGLNLDGSEDITLVADENFEISLDNVVFEGELTLPDYDGGETNIYVRLKEGLSIDYYDGIILIEGYDDEKEINVSGTVLAVPVITEADDLTAQVGEVFNYQIIATESPISYTISSESLPAGLVLNEETGIISGTPTVAGEFMFGVEATNSVGTSDEGYFIITVDKGTQTITELNNIAKTIEDLLFNLPETTNAELIVTYVSSNENVATIEGNTVTIVGLGDTIITATQAGDTNWNEFSQNITLTVTEAPVIPKVIISQVYEGASNNKWIELTNVGTTSVDLSQIQIAYWNVSGDAGNGNISGNPSAKTILSGTLAPGASYLLKNSGASASIPHNPMPDATFIGTTNVVNFNGNDPLALLDLDDNIIDAFGHGINNKDKSFHRKAEILSPNAIFTETEWIEKSLNEIAAATPSMSEYIGTHIYGGLTVWTINNEWLDGIVPTIIDSATIEGTLVITEGLSAKTITVAEGASLTIESGGVLTVEGKITNNGEFTVESDGILYQNNYTGTNEGNITVKRAANPMKRLDYTLWSSPVSGMLLNQFSNISNNGGTGTIWNRVYELGADAWSSIWESYAEASTSTDTFVEAKGYLYRAFNSYDPVTTTIFTGEFTGVPNNGDVIASTPNEFSAIGNPYPSPIDANDFITNNNADAIYFWTNVNSSNGTAYVYNNWASYTLLGGAGVTEGLEGETEYFTPEGTIQPGQGFVVFTEESSVSFDNSMRINSNGQFFRQMSNERHRFWLNLSNEEVVFNQILVGYMDNATQGVDTGIDGKMFAYEGSALYSIIENSDDNYVIQGRSLPFTTSDVVVLGFRAVNSGSFTISLNNFDGLFTDNQNIYLKDNFTQAVHNLKDGAYTFVSEEGIFNTRFEVVYQTAMSTENPEANNANWVVYSQEDGYQIQTQGFELKTVQVFDLLGRTIYTANAQGTAHNIPNLGADSVYIVKVTTTDNVVLSKKVK